MLTILGLTMGVIYCYFVSLLLSGGGGGGEYNHLMNTWVVNLISGEIFI